MNDLKGRSYEKLVVAKERLPIYLTTGREYKLIARGRMEDLERGLAKGGDKQYRICGTYYETLDHNSYARFLSTRRPREKIY